MTSDHVIATLTFDTTVVFVTPFHSSFEPWLSTKQPADVTTRDVA
jgi:hypothetical protein